MPPPDPETGNAWRAALDPAAHRRWVLISMTCSLLAMAGMIIAVPDIDAHPATFAFSVTWVIGGFVGLCTQKWLLGIDPWRCRFASWEGEGRVYRWIGVEAYRWLLRYTAMGWFNPAMHLNTSKASLEGLLRQMNFAEGAHWIGGALTLSAAAGYTFTGHRDAGLWFAIITILVHLYPAVLQRWNRGRITRLIRRIERSGTGRSIA